MKSISPNLNILIKACEKASKILVRDFGELENLQVSKKGPKDFVSSADKKVEKILIEELSKFKKNYSFLTEESGKIENLDKDNVWIIDPIDGTTNFLHGIPHFCISAALRTNNEIVSAVILDPIKNDIFFADKNNGSYLNNQRLRVSKRTNIDECLFGSNKNGCEQTNLNIRVSGSAALDLAYVGAGKLDGFFSEGLSLWDIAAGVLILEESGGKLREFNPLQIDNHNVIASSVNIHEKMLKNINNF